MYVTYIIVMVIRVKFMEDEFLLGIWFFGPLVFIKVGGVRSFVGDMIETKCGGR